VARISLVHALNRSGIPGFPATILQVLWSRPLERSRVNWLENHFLECFRQAALEQGRAESGPRASRSPTVPPSVGERHSTPAGWDGPPVPKEFQDNEPIRDYDDGRGSGDGSEHKHHPRRLGRQPGLR